MDREWLNLYAAQTGQWSSGQSIYLQFDNSVEIGGRDVQLWETSVGGSVLLLTENSPLTSYGDPEVFLTINYSNGAVELLSAPMYASFLLRDVAQITLSIIFPIGLPFVERVDYNALVNAHCIYEICDYPVM